MRFVCTSLLIHATVYRHTTIGAVSNRLNPSKYPLVSVSAGRVIRVRQYPI
jgi:hypothetical protein